MPEKYMTLIINGEDAYIRRDRLSQLRRINAVVFDCDGTLIDIRDSYDKAISKTVAYILKGLTGFLILETQVSDEIIFLFRKSGGFNDDWDTVYGILMFILCELPDNLRGTLKKGMEKSGEQPDPYKRFSSLRDAVKWGFEGALSDEFFEEVMDKLKGFSEHLDETGVESVDNNLVGNVENSEEFSDFYCIVKRYLRHPAGVGEGIIATVFEEFFCGAPLFRETYGIENRFNKGPGMIENERVLIWTETLDRLTSIIGKANLGVASGSRLESAKHVLGDILERFHSEALIFANDVERAEREYSENKGYKTQLKKPNPFPLLKSAEAFEPFNSALYVGDSMSDAMMVLEAKKLDPRFLFTGVYRYSYSEEAILSTFLESGCDMILPSVNELPSVLEEIGRLSD